MNSKGKILLAEDNPITAMSLKLFLTDVEFEVNDIAYGEQVVKSFKSSRPDLLLMDVLLRGQQNGIEAALEVRRFSDVPILFLSSSKAEHFLELINFVERCDILMKPYEYEELEGKIHSLLNFDRISSQD